MGCPKLKTENWRFVSAETAEYAYFPYGDLAKSSGPDADENPFLFSSEYLDSETNLVYYNYRYYSPELGRWTKRDPIEEDGGYNLYAMVGNDPVGRWDWLGLNRDYTRLLAQEYADALLNAAIQSGMDSAVAKRMKIATLDIADFSGRAYELGLSALLAGLNAMLGPWVGRVWAEKEIIDTYVKSGSEDAFVEALTEAAKEVAGKTDIPTLDKLPPQLKKLYKEITRKSKISGGGNGKYESNNYVTYCALSWEFDRILQKGTFAIVCHDACIKNKTGDKLEMTNVKAAGFKSEGSKWMLEEEMGVDTIDFTKSCQGVFWKKP